MYRRKKSHGNIRDEFVEGVRGFIQFAISNPILINKGNVLCPCSKCKNKKYWASSDVQYHLLWFGFVR